MAFDQNAARVIHVLQDATLQVAGFAWIADFTGGRKRGGAGHRMRADANLARHSPSEGQANQANLARASQRKAWMAHAWDGFPREVWDGNRSKKWQVISSREEYLSFLQTQHEDFGPAHTSINIGLGPALAPRYDSPWLNKALLELDGANGRPDTAYPKMRRLYTHLRLRYCAEPRVYFSGHRSFHLFVDFDLLPLTEPAEAQREFARRLVKEVSIMTLDFQVFAERKLSRVPYSYHEANVWDCVPISPFWSLDEVKKESRKPERFEPVRISFCQRLAAELRAIDKELTAKPKLTVTNPGPETTVADGRHRLLWHVLAPYMINVRKLTPDQSLPTLIEYFEKCNAITPLQPSRSRFMAEIRMRLKQSAKDGYPPWRRKTIEGKDPQLSAIINGVSP